MNYFQTLFTNILLATPNHRAIESCPDQNPVISRNVSAPERTVLLTGGVTGASLGDVKGPNTKVSPAEVIGRTSILNSNMKKFLLLIIFLVQSTISFSLEIDVSSAGSTNAIGFYRTSESPLLVVTLDTSLAVEVEAEYVLSIDGDPFEYGDREGDSHSDIASALASLVDADPELTKNKAFDNNTSAAVTDGAVSGVETSDDETVSAVATYDNTTIGTGKTITIGYALTGFNASFSGGGNGEAATGSFTLGADEISITATSNTAALNNVSVNLAAGPAEAAAYIAETKTITVTISADGTTTTAGVAALINGLGEFSATGGSTSPVFVPDYSEVTAGGVDGDPATADLVIDGVTIRITAASIGTDLNGRTFRVVGAYDDGNGKVLDSTTPVSLVETGSTYTLYALPGTATHDDLRAALDKVDGFSAAVTSGTSSVIGGLALGANLTAAPATASTLVVVKLNTALAVADEDEYKLVIFGEEFFPYVAAQEGDTHSTIATKLAAFVNADSRYTANAVGSSIEISDGAGLANDITIEKTGGPDGFMAAGSVEKILGSTATITLASGGSLVVTAGPDQAGIEIRLNGSGTGLPTASLNGEILTVTYQSGVSTLGGIAAAVDALADFAAVADSPATTIPAAASVTTAGGKDSVAATGGFTIVGSLISVTASLPGIAFNGVSVVVEAGIVEAATYDADSKNLRVTIKSDGTTTTATVRALIDGLTEFNATGGSSGRVFEPTYSSVTSNGLDPATQIAINAGNDQSATVGTAVAIAPSVLVTDAYDIPVAGVEVTFAVVTGGGTVVPTTAVTTDENGIASVTSWTMGSTAGPNTLTATSGSLSGSPLTFTATGTAGAPQNLTISSSGDTGTSGDNWSITGNILNVGASGSATINPSVITNHLDNTGDLTVNLPWQNGQIRQCIINGSITYTGSATRMLTFNIANDILMESANHSISATNGALNVILRTAIGPISSSPDDGRISIRNNNTINTNGGHLWMGGGSGTTTWNSLTVGNSVARTWEDNVPGLWIESATLNTNGGNSYLSGLSHNTNADNGENYGVLIDNSSITSASGNIEVKGDVTGRFTNASGTRVVSTTGTTSIATTTGSITIRGNGTDQAPNGNGWRHGMFIRSASASNPLTISTTTGNILLEGAADFDATVNDKEGISLTGSGLNIVSQTGNITLRGTNTLESSGQYSNSIRFATVDVANSIRIGYDGTNAYSGNINIEGNSIYQRNTYLGAGSIAVQTTGNLTIQPTGTAFTYMRAADSGPLTYDDDWNFGTTLGSFTLGKTTNTANITFSNNLSVAGAINVYGGHININENLNTSSGTTSSNVLLKASGDVILASSKSITTSGGDVILWSNSDGQTTNGGAFLKQGSGITTGGGHIWMAGGGSNTTWNGLTVGDGYAVSGSSVASGITDMAYSGSNIYNAGINLYQVTLSSGGGDIYMAGQRNLTSGYGAGIVNFSGTGTLIDAGSGAVTIKGDNIGAGILVPGIMTGLRAALYTGAFVVQSVNTSATNAITIEGTTSAGSETAGILIEGKSRLLSKALTGGAGISVIANSVANGNAIAIGRSAYNSSAVFDVLSASGAIDVNVGVYSIVLPLSNYKFNLGSITSDTDVASSAANVLITSNVVNWTGSVPVRTTGTLTVTPTANNSFTSVFNTSSLNYTGISGLTIGNPSNTANITFGATTTIAGPITAYGGTIAVNAALTATNSNINLTASTAATQTAAITANGLALNGAGTFTLNNTANNIATIAGGSSAAKIGSLSFVDAAGGLEIGTVNPTGITSTGPIKIETLEGNITLSENLATDDTTADAIILNAGKTAAIGTATGGDIIVSGTPTLTYGTDGRAKLFSGRNSNSTGLTDLVGGVPNTRVNVDETTATFSPVLAVDTSYALYRAEDTKAPIISNFNNVNKMYFDGSYSIEVPTSNSLGAFSYTSSNTAVATISGSTVTILSAGTSTITANQAANANYTSESITATLTVSSVSVLTNTGAISSTNLNYVNKYGQIGGNFGLSANGAVLAAKTPPPIVSAGLVLHLDAGNPASYSGTGTTWTDISGNGNHGTLVNGVGYTSANSGALVFDGVNDYVSTNLFLNTITNVTLQGWVYISSTSLKGPFIRVGSGENGYAIGVGAGSFDTPGNQIIGLFPFVRWISTGNNYGTGWKFFTLTLSETAVPTFYLNGTLIGSFSGSNPKTPDSGAYIAINFGDRPDVRIFAGNIAQVSIYTRALTALEIQQNYNAVKSRYGL